MPHAQIFLLLTTALAMPALAQAAPATDSIIVTGLRTPLPIDHVAASVTVLDHAAIDASQALVVSDLIARTPGVTVSRTGGFGTTTGVRIRGAESDQTVVVIDGVKLNDPSAPGGGYDFGDLFVGDAAQIEDAARLAIDLVGQPGDRRRGQCRHRPADHALPRIGRGRRRIAWHRERQGRRSAARSDASSWQLAGNALRTDGISAIAPEFGGQERDGYRHYRRQRPACWRA
jgi:vitamin B12 transporter